MQSCLPSYDSCTKFVVSCHPNFNFPYLFFLFFDLHDIYGGCGIGMVLFDPHKKKGKKDKKRIKFAILEKSQILQGG